MRRIVIVLAGVFVLANSGLLSAQSTLKGSRTAMRKQNNIAHDQDYTFLRTSKDVRRFVDQGLLVRVKNTSSLRLADVSFPYARPAIKTFAERLASQYRDACGNRLVVTSLTRPLSRQPWNASDLSVHPAGMAVDIRVSDRRSCRHWLEETLMSLERKGVLEATRERFPAHYHVAVFPEQYFAYLGKAVDQAETKLASTSSEEKATTYTKSSKPIANIQEPKYASIVPLPTKKAVTHKVRSGESLWTIARKHGVTVTALKRANDLNGSRIRPGQVLAIPRARSAEAD